MSAKRLFQDVAVQIRWIVRKVLIDGARSREKPNRVFRSTRRCSRWMMIGWYDVAPDSSAGTVNRRGGASG
jgi:hypothetical protein